MKIQQIIMEWIGDGLDWLPVRVPSRSVSVPRLYRGNKRLNRIKYYMVVLFVKKIHTHRMMFVRSLRVVLAISPNSYSSSLLAYYDTCR